MRTRLYLTIMAAALSLTCDSTPPASTFVVSLTSPNRDDGAVSALVGGPGVANARTLSNNYRVFSRIISPDVLHVIVIGDLTDGPLFSVQGTKPIVHYAVSVAQVASRTDELRYEANYRLTLTSSQD